MIRFIILLYVWKTAVTIIDGLPTDTLLSGAVLKENEMLVSQNKAYYAVMQADGNFVIYTSNTFDPKNSIWASGIEHKGFVDPYRLVMQDDGNLIVYDDYQRTMWSSRTDFKGIKPHRLIMQSDGNLVLYDGKSNPTWSSGTAHTR